MDRLRHRCAWLHAADLRGGVSDLFRFIRFRRPFEHGPPVGDRPWVAAACRRPARAVAWRTGRLHWSPARAAAGRDRRVERCDRAAGHSRRRRCRARHCAVRSRARRPPARAEPLQLLPAADRRAQSLRAHLRNRVGPLLSGQHRVLFPDTAVHARRPGTRQRREFRRRLRRGGGLPCADRGCRPSWDSRRAR